MKMKYVVLWHYHVDSPCYRKEFATKAQAEKFATVCRLNRAAAYVEELA